MESFVSFVQNVGFPVFVAIFLLVRIEPTLKHINETLAKILQFMQNHTHP